MPTSIKRFGIAIALIVVALMVLAIKEARTEPMWVTQYADSYCGLVTSSGEVMDCGAYTAASSYLPYNSVVRVFYADGFVDVRITDTCACPLDLSPAAALEIGLPGADVADVEAL